MCYKLEYKPNVAPFTLQNAHTTRALGAATSFQNTTLAAVSSCSLIYFSAARKT